MHTCCVCFPLSLFLILCITVCVRTCGVHGVSQIDETWHGQCYCDVGWMGASCEERVSNPIDPYTAIELEKVQESSCRMPLGSCDVQTAECSVSCWGGAIATCHCLPAALSGFPKCECQKREPEDHDLKI